ncbi:MAG TPA: 16S rRNA (adenine(1518)-N(6)/adenine(1519)-N(6))-dimethyltransferase RsmA [Bacillota bacterium]|nr:16S rRNA (adenine(1518)-N(6)/adenine(1519)-N(6))-dimethyltransferase RsmA [Bacillota bacterium]
MRKSIATPSTTNKIVQKYNLTLKKSLGQNFIIDENILINMIKTSEIAKDSGVIEIGPGIGALTEQLAIAAKKVVAYEIDERLLPVLEDTLSPYQNVEIFHEDILNVDLHQTIKKHFSGVSNVHIVANLPYYVTTPILFALLEADLPITSITIMIQKEVAERMAANPGSKEYGSLTIAVQYYTVPKLVMEVPKTVFTPAPKVTSAVLHLVKRKESLVQVEDEKYFFSIVKASFAHRRKTLRNNMISFLKNRLSKEEIDEVFAEVDIDSRRRGESLSIQEYASLANAFYKAEAR